MQYYYYHVFTAVYCKCIVHNRAKLCVYSVILEDGQSPKVSATYRSKVLQLILGPKGPAHGSIRIELADFNILEC